MVWKAISSMVLMILAMSELEVLMASMAVVIAAMLRTPWSPAWRAWLPSSLTLLAVSALRWVMLAISSSEELVSSSEAACSLAPSARDWLAEEICEDAAEVCWAPADRVSASCLMGWVMERVMVMAEVTPTITPMTSMIKAMSLEVLTMPLTLVLLSPEAFQASFSAV